MAGVFYGGYRFQEDGGLHLLVCDPQTFPAGELLEHLTGTPRAPTSPAGWPTAGGTGRGAHLFLDGKTVDSGAVGARLTGVAADVVVSQGCRPMGSPYTVTRAEGNVLHELGGRPPFERLKAIVATSEPDRKSLADGGLQLGRVIDEYRPEERRGDFLVRRVVRRIPTPVPSSWGTSSKSARRSSSTSGIPSRPTRT